MYPENLYDFAWFGGQFEQHLSNLVEMAEPEPWKYQFTPNEKEFPILFNYIHYTYKRLVEENKIAISQDNNFSCFDTGLMTKTQEPIYAFFQKNRQKDKEVNRPGIAGDCFP